MTYALKNTAGTGLPKDVTLNFEPVGTEYEQFYDLGNYLILLKENKNVKLSDAIALVRDTKGLIVGGCSSAAKRNRKGEVIVGRNMDLPATLYPAFLSVNTFGKYKTLSVSYVGTFFKNMGCPTYEEILKAGKISPELYNAIPFASPGAFNEKGLYVAGDMRYGEKFHLNYGTNPGKETVDLMSLPTLVTANCANVKEALEYVKTEYNWITRFGKTGNVEDDWNIAFMLADAEGDYGLLEIAHDRIKFIPYQPGHANYYVTPMFETASFTKEGVGRLQTLFDHLLEPQTEEEMQAIMPYAYCSSLFLNIYTAYRDADGKIQFVDKDGNPTMDWRCEAIAMLEGVVPVDEDGVMHPETSPDKDFVPYMIAHDLGDEEIMKKYKDVYDSRMEDYKRCTGAAIYDDKNFEAVQQCIIRMEQSLCVRDLLKEYYAGNEMPLRTDTRGVAWLAGECVGVNCAKKHINIMFWENRNVKMDLQW